MHLQKPALCVVIVAALASCSERSITLFPDAAAPDSLPRGVRDGGASPDAEPRQDGGCKAGEIQACPDLGECRGGRRTCVGGSFGPCEWTTGPTVEICDEKDNDCDGEIDELLGCCEADCSGKACGADDGCGGKCQTGTCQNPQQQTCQAGICVPLAGDFVWTTSAGGGSADAGRAIALDASGNTYVVGEYLGSVTFGATTLQSGAQHALFVAKLSPSGAFLWATSAAGSGSLDGSGIAVDASGNVYVTGYFLKSASFGATKLSAKGSADIFVAKLSPSGAFLWATSAGGSSVDRGTGIAVDAAGDAYVTGYHDHAATFGATTLAASGFRNVFVAKIAAAGSFLWATSASGAYEAEGHGIAVDPAGNVHVTGLLSGTATFGATTLTTDAGDHLLVTKLTSAGSFVWAVTSGGAGHARGNSISVDASGNCHVAGTFDHVVALGATTLSSPKSENVLVTKLSSSGAFLWATAPIVVKPGTAFWEPAGLGIAVDGQSQASVTGRFVGSMIFGPSTLDNKVQSGFVARLSPSGSFLRAVQVLGDVHSEGLGIAVDASGYAHVTGYFDGTATFGAQTFTAKGSDDVYVTKLAP